MGLFGSFFKSQIDKDLEMMESGRLGCPPPYLPESEIEADIMYGRFPEKFICEGPTPGITKFCVDNGHIYEGFIPGGSALPPFPTMGISTRDFSRGVNASQISVPTTASTRATTQGYASVASSTAESLSTATTSQPGLPTSTSADSNCTLYQFLCN